MERNPFEIIGKLHTDILEADILNHTDLESFRVKYLGSKNIIRPLFKHIKEVPNDQKKNFGHALNELKQSAEDKYNVIKARLVKEERHESYANLDWSAPGVGLGIGSRHPISVVMEKIKEIFGNIGFSVAEDREIEDDWHNFTAMNTPEDHPARDMQDTFYLKDSSSILLRTHTSSVQSRVMKDARPPIRIIAPGRVYRNETISARAHCQFHQVEGLYINENVSFADLKQTLLYFAREMYGEQTKIRLRPSYFPFTEPSAEMDVSCFICNAKGCNICKYTGWVEILGCGMVDPQVLINCDIDPEKYTGFAFGMGVERQAMLKYQINDIRLLFENDIRFLDQFKSA